MSLNKLQSMFIFSVFAGVTVAYNGDDVGDSFALTSQCNSACACDDELYDPVCGSNGVTYFSSCHAGCTEKLVRYTAGSGVDGGRIVSWVKGE